MTDRLADGSDLLTAVGAVRYWEERHRTQGELRSGGHIGLDEAANQIFYFTRLGMLLRIIGVRNSVSAPLFLLDAGCGKGQFVRALVSCGFAVDGIDTSPTAIDFCRASGPGRYEVSSIADWRSPTLYDVVYSVDVLFHLVDDDDWAASLDNLASLVRLGGKLVITDEHAEVRRQAGNYIVHRASTEYVEALGRRGFALREFVPYAFRDSRIGFLIFIRQH
jgi:2-polyprenyl-3-methyl-5-hydroxy-6-metoxy-1,4-benzoquinol methylase